MIVEAWLQRAARARGQACAIQTPRGELSYTQLWAAARSGAAALAKRGVGRGDQVAIALAPGLDFAVALHACLLLGAVAVPIDLRMAESERRRLMGAAAVVLEEPLAVNAQAGPLDGAAGHDLSQTAVIIHTSGTTSTPKPVQLTYGNFLWSAIGSAVALGSGPQERWLCALPLSHVGGLSILIRSVIYQSTAVVHERFETDRVLHALASQRITLVSLVATTLSRLLDAGLAQPPQLRCALTGGGPVPASLLARADSQGVAVSLTYGLSEACSQVTTTPINAIAGVVEDAGPPLFCTQLKIAADGEILVAGPTVSPSALSPDGWLHTGDEGYLDEQHALRITGRKADTIITGGENVAPSEVEAALEAHPAVTEAAVLGVADERWGEAVTAIVVVAPACTLDAAALRAHCSERLAPYKVPKRVIFSDRPLPRTTSGKLRRAQLADRLAD